MKLERYVVSGGKRLRCGYTTGSCAAAAAKAAALMLCRRAPVREVTIGTPKGVPLTLTVEEASFGARGASCGVRKDAGDDADATDGLLIRAECVWAGPEGAVEIDGGTGVGRVTLPGLDQPVGAAAINRVPREMIAREVREALAGRACGIRVLISAPEGAAAAQRTYNSRLGIEGGISILGTTGIVEPMSEAALIDTIRVELDVLRAAGGGPVLMTPGNYGETFCRERLGLRMGRTVLCSNYLGDALDYAAALGLQGVLLVGHLGKLVKLAGGVFNTHSRTADARMEILTAHAALAGAPRALLEALMAAPTTDAAADLLDGAGLLGPVMERAMERLAFHLRRRAGNLPTEAVVFTNPRGVLGMTDGARAMLEQFQKEEG